MGTRIPRWLRENEELDARLVSAISHMDIDGLMSCSTDSPDLIAVLWGTEMHGAAELREAAESVFSQCDSLTMTIDRVSRIRNGSNVVAVGKATYMMIRNGVPCTVREVWTDVRRKRNGKWVYMLGHAEVLPGT